MVASDKKGRINADLFIQWPNYFITHIRPTNKIPILLCMDNHAKTMDQAPRIGQKFFLILSYV